MKEDKLDQLQEEKAREAAKSLSRTLLAPVRVLKKGLSPQKEITIADMIQMGAVFLSAINDGYRDAILKKGNRALINKVLESIHSPEPLEEFLYERIKHKPATETELDAAIAEAEEFMSRPGGVMRMLKSAIAEAVPKATRGRPSSFNPATDPDKFLFTSAELEGTCRLFLGLRHSLPGKSTKDLLDFIQSESPKTVTLLKKHAGYISRIVQDPDFEEVRGEATRARYLADAVAGHNLLRWSYKYSIQRGHEFRRARLQTKKE